MQMPVTLGNIGNDNYIVNEKFEVVRIYRDADNKAVGVYLNGNHNNRAEDEAKEMASNYVGGHKNFRAMAAEINSMNGNAEGGGWGGVSTGLPPLKQQYTDVEADACGALHKEEQA